MGTAPSVMGTAITLNSATSLCGRTPRRSHVLLMPCFTRSRWQCGYHTAIRSLISSGQTRLMLNIDDLRGWNREIAQNFMRRPAEFLPAFEEALRDIITSFEPSYAKQGAASEFRIGVIGSFGTHLPACCRTHAATMAIDGHRPLDA